MLTTKHLIDNWQVLEGVVLQMDPSLRPDQAETFTDVLKVMGESAKTPEVVQEIANAVKQVDNGNSNQINKRSDKNLLLCFLLIF